jgi:pyruvate formate lyase activating enzyme
MNIDHLMKIISLAKNADLASISFSGCPMKCGFCMHNRQDRKDVSIEKMVSDICTPAIKRVYIGGMDPVVQRKELRTLILTLKQRGLEVTLKTSGFDPEFLKDMRAHIDRFVIEIENPLDDIKGWSDLSGKEEDWTKNFLENLKASLEIVKGRPLRITVRLIPGYVTEEKLAKIGQQLRPYAQEALLSQFLGNQLNDYPWGGITDASPPESEVVQMGQVMNRSIPWVKVTGAGFERTFSR